MPNPRVQKALDKIIYFERPRLGLQYSSIPRSSGQVNLEHLINGKPCWIDNSSMSEAQPEKKKFIISDWSIKYGIEDEFDRRKLFTLLLEQGVDAYVYTGKLEKVKDIHDLMVKLYEVQVIHADKLKQILAEYNISSDEAEIIDYLRAKELDNILFYDEQDSKPLLRMKIFNYYKKEDFQLLQESIDSSKEFYINLWTENRNDLEEIQLPFIYSLPVKKVITNIGYDTIDNGLIKDILEKSQHDLCLYIGGFYHWKYKDYLDLLSCLTEAQKARIHTIEISSEKEQVDLYELLKNHPNLYGLKIYRSEILIDLVKFKTQALSLSNFQELSLDECKFDDLQWQTLLSSVPELKSLKIKNVKIENDGDYTGFFLHKLEKLEVHKSDFDVCQFDRLLSSAPSLKEIKTDFIAWRSPLTLIKLESLSFDVYKSIPGSWLKVFNQVFPNLVELNLPYVRWNDDESLPASFLNLKNVSIKSISLDGLAQLLKACPKLVTFKGKIESVSIAELQLSTLDELQEIKLDFSDYSNDEENLGLEKRTLNYFAKCAPNLKKITIETDNDINTDEFNSEYPLFEKVEEFNNSYNCNNYLTTMLAACPNLKIISTDMEVITREQMDIINKLPQNVKIKSEIHSDDNKYTQFDAARKNTQLNSNDLKKFQWENVVIGHFLEWEDYTSILEAAPLLERLTLRINENALDELSLPENAISLELPALREMIIKIDNDLELTNENILSIQVLIRYCPNLERLIIQYNDGEAYTIASVNGIKLRQLVVNSCIFNELQVSEYQQQFPEVSVYPDSFKIIKESSHGNNYNNAYQSSGIDIDAPKKNKTLNARVLFYPKDESGFPEPATYRLQGYDDILLGKKIELVTKSEKIDIIGHCEKSIYDCFDEYLTKHHHTSDIFYGSRKFQLNDYNEGGWFPLAALSDIEQIMQLHASIALEIGYKYSSKLYYIRPIGDRVNNSFQINFMVKSKINELSEGYFNFPDLPFNLLTFENNGSLRKDIYYQFLYSNLSALTQDQKIYALINFCRQFVADTPHALNNTDISKLNAIIQQKKGVCRHRVWAFMALAKMFGIQAYAYNNDLHAFVALTIQGQPMQVCLGGGEVNVKLHPLEMNEKASIVSNKTVENIKPQKPSALNAFCTWDTFQTQANNLEEYCVKIIRDLQKLPRGKRNILVALSPHQIENFNFYMANLLHKNGNEHLYLHDLDEVSENDARVIDGQLDIQQSQFISFMKQAKTGDVFLTNWTNYKSAHVGYNSMLDSDERKIKSHDISPEAGIIVVIDKTKLPCMGDDFFSRLRERSLCPDFPTAPFNITQGPATNTNETAMCIPFFNNDWQSLLKGAISVSGNSFIMQTGVIELALQKNIKVLVLQNAPWEDINFRLFITELLIKRKFTCNGKIINLPDDFIIKSVSFSYDLRSDYLHFTPAKESNDYHFILNIETLGNFIKNLRSHGDRIYVDHGWIEQNKGKTLSICMTEKLPRNALANLKSLAETHRCRLEISDISSADSKFAKVPGMEIIVTNDLEMAEKESFDLQPDSVVISINDSIYFSDLIEKPVKLPSEHPGDIRFKSMLGSVWQKLMKGESVILKGSLSAKLANQIATLFLANPYLWVNGQKQYPQGKLTIITDKPNPLAFVNASERHYHESTINQEFAHNKMFSQSMTEFKKSCPSIKFGYGQLKQMMFKIEKGSKSNPFKPFFRLNANKDILAAAKKAWLKDNEGMKVDMDNNKRQYKILSELALSPYLFVAGASGIGKSTHIIEELKKAGSYLHVGIDNLEQWARAQGDEDHILFIDEANLEAEGTWDMLEGIFNKTKGILIDGEFTPLGNHHKIIFAGNFNHFVGRKQHGFFERHGQVINFKEWSLAQMRDIIIMPALQALFAGIPEDTLLSINTIIQDFYQKINTDFPGHPFTLRNLKSICLRFHCLCNDYEENYALKLALMQEAHSLLNKSQRQLYREYLQMDKPILKPLPDRIGSLVITPSRKQLLNLLYQQLAMRDLLINNTEFSLADFKGFLIEGASGIGKSQLVIAALKQKNIKFYHLTPSDPEKMKQILLQAFHEGSVVVIDELNSLPLERLMNQLLSGYDPDGNPAKQKGFFVIGTQNPVSFSKRQVLSSAFLNRFNKYCLKDYTQAELLEIVSEICCIDKNADKLVYDYFKAKKYAHDMHLHPEPTPRDLFEYLKINGYLENAIHVQPKRKQDLFSNCFFEQDSRPTKKMHLADGYEAVEVPELYSLEEMVAEFNLM